MGTKTYADETPIEKELSAQPEHWDLAADIGHAQSILPVYGMRIAVVGCGSFRFMAQAHAQLREEGGFGETDAFLVSEASIHRDYDAVIALSRSGTAREMLNLAEDLKDKSPLVGVIGEASSPLMDLTERTITLPFAGG